MMITLLYDIESVVDVKLTITKVTFKKLRKERYLNFSNKVLDIDELENFLAMKRCCAV